MKLKLKEDKAITLVALVVTIVVLLILAGVALNLVLGENGIVASATNPIIPECYYAINVGEATWNGEGGPAYNKGLVITDSIDASRNSNGNE